MSIITEDIRAEHTITGFVFGDLDSNEKSSYDGFEPFPTKTVAEPVSIGTVSPQNNSIENRDDIDRREGMISSLMEKSDSLSRELISVQNQLSNQENLFKNEMRDLKENSYNQGLKDGIQQAKTDMDNLYSDKLNQLDDSIKKINELSSKMSSVMKSVEPELIHTSIAIAKEVIDSEISFNSGQVAINLAKSLMQKLDEAKDIKIRVNINDFESLKLGLSNLENIEIIPDSAVTKGGIILISDVGTIEGNIMERYKKIKSDALSKIDG